MDFTPERVLVITPHPDDAEAWAGGTIARWARAGAEVHCVLCTDGSKGSDDREIDPAELAATRGREQRAAAEILGINNVVTLGWPDGELEDTADFRKDLVRQIRTVKPEVVLTSEPYRAQYAVASGPPHRRSGCVGRRFPIRPRSPSFRRPFRQ